MGSEDDDQNESGASRKIMLFAILSLFCAVVLIVFLYLYSRYLLRREERRRQLNNLYRLSRQQIAPETGNDQPGNESGLDPLIIASLPTFKYKKLDKVDHGGTVECSICLGTVVEDVVLKVLPNCKHMFHVECIDMWLGSHTTCPICRTTVEPTIVQEEVKTEPPSDQVVQPSAPPLEESTGTHGGARLEKVSGSSSSRFGSFRRMFSRGRSSRTRSCEDEICVNDIERQ